MTEKSTGDKAKEVFDTAKDKVSDKFDELKAENEVKKAEADRDSVKAKNKAKDAIR